MPIIVIAGIVVCVALLARWRAEFVAHRRRVEAVQWRVHVNGIRGKSTVTRIIAGMMREAGMTAVAKSTGTFAAVINSDGVDEPIERKGPPTILEQIDVCREYLTSDVDALVIECMALKPEYQEVSERMIVRSNIGVLTNVREDHQDVMGETLPEIARALLSTCPLNGVLITSDQNPEILDVMREVCESQGTELIVADPDRVTDEENLGFEYISFKENVTIALTIADIIGIPRDVAIRGMIKAEPDPGVLRMKELAISGKKVTWANLFAVNDRESMVAAMEKLTPFQTDETITVGILNNRSDRERRAIQFADVAVHDLAFDRLVTFGAYEGLVTDRLLSNGYAAEHILNLGDEHHATQDEIIRRMITEQPSDNILVVGFVNIHTHQAEEMLEYFEHQAEPWSDSAAVAAGDRPSSSTDSATDLPRRTIDAFSDADLTTTHDSTPDLPQRTTTPERHLEPAAADLPQRTTTPERHLEPHFTHDLSTAQHRPLDQPPATLPRRLVEAGSALEHRPSDQSDALTHRIAPQPHARRDEDVPALPRRGG